MDTAGPIGFEHIDSAPKDGRYVRLRFRRVEGETIGKWKRDPDLKAGGFWCDMEGCYISPGPLFWAPRFTLKAGERKDG